MPQPAQQPSASPSQWTSGQGARAVIETADVGMFRRGAILDGLIGGATLAVLFRTSQAIREARRSYR